MRLRNSPDSYGGIAQTPHWTVVSLVVVAWLLGTFDDVFPRGPKRQASLFVHISAGRAVPVVVVLRLVWRIGDPPQCPRGPFWVFGDFAGQLTPMLRMPSSLQSRSLEFWFNFPEVTRCRFSAGLRLRLRGLLIAPLNVPSKKFLRFLPKALMILAGLHAAAALAYHWLLRDRTLVRMLPHSKLEISTFVHSRNHAGDGWRFIDRP